MFFQAQKNPKLAEEILKDLDHDRDDLLNFEEFLPFYAGLALACEKGQIVNQKKSKKWSATTNDSFNVSFSVLSLKG